MEFRRKRLLHILWIAPLILYIPVLFTGKLTYYGTISLQFLPWRWLGWQMLRGGELPLWNTYLGMGSPLAANYQSAFFYPPNWILFFVSWLGGLPGLAWGQGLLTFLHLVLAAAGMSQLAKSLGLGVLARALSGLAYGLSGYLVARAHFPSINAAAAWLPWILYGVREVIQWGGAARVRSSLLLACAFALQLLSGHAQTTFYTLLLSVIWGLYWLLHKDEGAHSQSAGEKGKEERNWGAVPFLAAAGFFGLLISAVQLLPTAELMQLSQRAAGAEENFVMTYSFWPWRFLGLVLPGFFGQPASGIYWGYANYWEDAVYIGLLPLLMAIRAIRRSKQGVGPRSLLLLLGVVSLVSFLLALGKNTPVFPLLYRHVPGFDLFQAPTRYSIWAVFSLSLLAGFGIQDWAGTISTHSRRQAGRWTAAAFALVLAGGAVLFFLPFIERSFGIAILTAGLIGTCAAAFGLSRKRGLSWRSGLILLVAVDLIIAGWGLNPIVDGRVLSKSPGNAAVIRSRLGDGRLYADARSVYEMTFSEYFPFSQFATDLTGLRSSLLPGLNVLDEIPSANQFDPLLPARYDRWMSALDEADAPTRSWMLAESNITMTERYLAGDPEPLRFESVEARPRAAWFSCARQAGNAVEAFSIVMGMAEAGETGLVVEGQTESACEQVLAGRAIIVRERANAITIQVSADSEGWLLLRDTFYPGWAAEINGESADVLPGNFAFRAVRVPAGSSEINMAYRPLSFRIGAGLSLIGLLCVGLAWYRVRRSE